MNLQPQSPVPCATCGMAWTCTCRRVEPRTDPVEELRLRWHRLAANLWRAMFDGDNGKDYEAYMVACNAWSRANDMARALDWLLLDELPIHHTGLPAALWVPEWFAGPWPEERRP